MSRPLRMPRAKLVIAVAAVAVLSGCASVNLEQNISSANAATSSFTDGKLTLARAKNEQEALRRRASDLLANPILSLERVRLGSETEIGRILSFGLLDLLTLPTRKGIAEQRIKQTQLRLSSDV